MCRIVKDIDRGDNKRALLLQQSHCTAGNLRGPGEPVLAIQRDRIPRQHPAHILIGHGQDDLIGQGFPDRWLLRQGDRRLAKAILPQQVCDPLQKGLRSLAHLDVQHHAQPERCAQGQGIGQDGNALGARPVANLPQLFAGQVPDKLCHATVDVQTVPCRAVEQDRLAIPCHPDVQLYHVVAVNLCQPDRCQGILRRVGRDHPAPVCDQQRMPRPDVVLIL